MSKSYSDFSTIISIFLTFTLIICAIIIGGNIISFIDAASFLIVIFGTYSILIGCYSFKEVHNSLINAFSNILTNQEDLTFSAISALSVAEFAYRNGILSLENYNEIETDNEIFLKGLELVVDNHPLETIDKIIFNGINSKLDRDDKTIELVRKGAEVSPAMGLIGTLIGLVQMLGNLNDVSKIGPAMAVALLTTFYGSILAYVVLFPLANKLERNLESEKLTMNLYYIAIMSIAKKENPRQLETMINNILPQNKRVKYFD